MQNMFDINNSDIANINTDLIKFNQASATKNSLGATNDNEAIAIFLHKVGSRSYETYRRYEREITRFTAFIYLELQVNFNAVKLKHIQTYLAFIQNLPNKWLQPGILAGQPQRVLFKSSVAPGKSTDGVINVLSSFFTFLSQSLYLTGNPFTGISKTGEKDSRSCKIERYFYDNEWQFICKCLSSMLTITSRQKQEKARTKYLFSLAYNLALRESELTDHSCNNIQKVSEDNYVINIIGKGKKKRQIPLNSITVTAILDYRKLYGLLSIEADNFPLAPSIKTKDGKLQSLSSRGLRFWWKSFMNYCASKAESQLAAKLKNIPFHTLRHTALTHLARNVKIEDLAIFAGHSSINTTSIYYHTEISRMKTLLANHGVTSHS